MSGAGSSARGGVAALAACFLLSGMGSLVLEVVWTRQLRLVFGSTTLAVSTILVAYMLGLGLGGLIAGRLAGRLRSAVAVYGALEMAVAFCAAVVPFVIGLYPELNRLWLGELPWATAVLARFTLSLAVLLVPTIMMGATLPVLTVALLRHDPRIGASVGLLYGLNTLGAVAGVLVSTFGLLPALGLLGTNFAGATLDLVAGVVALAWLSPGFLGEPVPAEPASHRFRWGIPLISYGAVGFSALIYEVGWTRALSMVLGSSIYAFAAMLGAFLAGIALGSLAIRPFVDRVRRPERLYAAGIVGVAVLSLATTWLLPELPPLFLWGVERLGTSSSALPLIHVGVSVVAMLPPTLVLGALFPLLARVLSRERESAPGAVGDAYFVNTVGSAAGAFAAGFLLIPALGLRDALILAACVDLLAAAALFARLPAARPTRLVAAGALAAVAAALLGAPPPWNPESLARGVFYDPIAQRARPVELLPLIGVPENELLFYRDGVSSAVSVHRHAGVTYLRINGKTDASNGRDMVTQVMLGEIPLLFGRPVKDVLVIGHASGVTVGSVARHPVERIDTVELEPAVLEASRFFDIESGAPLDDPRVHAIIDDGRTYLTYTPRRYDVIISEPPNPWMTGASSLFTREFFRAARGALRPAGRLVQWVHLYGMDLDGLRSILAAMRAEFPYVYGFTRAYGSGDLWLLASLQPLSSADLPRWEGLSDDVREDLRRVGSFMTEDVWSLLHLLPADVDALIGEHAVVNRDDNLYVELRAPWAIYEPTTDANWVEVARVARGVLPLLGGREADRTGVLAWSYLTARQNLVISSAISRFESARGASAGALAARAFATHSGGGPPELVLRLLDEALAKDARSGPARLLRAEVLAGVGRNEEALADVEVALQVVPGDPEAEVLRARVLNALGRSAEAADAVAAVLRRPYARLHPQVSATAARILIDAGRLSEAALALEAYLEVEPHSPEEWRALSAIRAALSEPGEAERARENAEIAAENRARLMAASARR